MQTANGVVEPGTATVSAEAVEFAQQIDTTSSRVAHALRKMQAPEGYWCGDLTADSTLESDYVLLQLWLHPPQGGRWNPPTRQRVDRACATVISKQLPDGGWNIYPGGPSEVNASVKAYSALKIAGHSAQEPYMVKARECILRLGGVQACNSYVRINLSLFGLYPREAVPSVPPEIMLIPGDIIYEMSSWTRSIVIPLAVVQAAGGVRAVPQGVTVEEIFMPGRKFAGPRRESLTIVFHHIDRIVKLWERRGSRNMRAKALRECEHWLLDRTRYTEGLGAIYPAMMYMIMALESLGYPSDHPDLIEAIQHFDNLLIETEDRFQFQPCVSPVWDTAITLFAMGEAGQGNADEMTRAADWLLSKECRRKGDWSVKRPYLEPSGWAFEFANEYYPDIDDTAMVLLALTHAKSSDPERQKRVTTRAVNWLLGMQGRDGGWAAFDVDNNWQILNKIPWSDHNAMLDPSCPDITGRVLEALARSGVPNGHEAVHKGVRYLLNVQEKNGSWYGRWGVNYIYGTFLALRGLKASNASMAYPAMQKAAQWIRSVQNVDGGWGEHCVSYKKLHYVAAPSTASQTAWALLGLAAAGDTSSPACRRGIEFLLRTQREDGTWAEDLATGTGFPNVFFLTYHMYRNYFPLLALAAVKPQFALAAGEHSS
ncbi:MAG TPA: squalene--hopene cyclase [Terriglobales bacterium]